MHSCEVPEQKPSAPGAALAHVHASPSAFVPPPVVPLVPPLVVPLEPVSFGHNVSKFDALSCEQGFASRHES